MTHSTSTAVSNPFVVGQSKRSSGVKATQTNNIVRTSRYVFLLLFLGLTSFWTLHQQIVGSPQQSLGALQGFARGLVSSSKWRRIRGKQPASPTFRKNFTSLRSNLGGTYNGTHFKINRHLFLPSSNRYFSLLMPDNSSSKDNNTRIKFTDWTTEIWSVFDVLFRKGWIHIDNPYDKRVHLLVTKNLMPKWLNRHTQLINNIGKIQNACLAGNKLQQLQCRRAFAQYQGCEFEELDISPLQYNFENVLECRQFFSKAIAAQDDKMYLIKPIGTEHGDGIRVFHSYKDMIADYSKCINPLPVLAMEYVSNPATFKGRKVDLRTFMLVAALQPKLVFYHDGYARVSDQAYNATSTEENIHITNARGLLYTSERFMDFPTLEQKLHEQLGFPRDHFRTYVVPRAKAVTRFVVEATLHEMHPHPGRFQMYGLDWTLDDQGKLGLLEVNATPLTIYLPGVEMSREMWDHYLELVIILHNSPKLLGPKVTVKDKFEYNGWHLIFNEVETKYEEEKTGTLYDSCEVFIDRWDELWRLPRIIRPKQA